MCNYREILDILHGKHVTLLCHSSCVCGQKDGDHLLSSSFQLQNEIFSLVGRKVANPDLFVTEALLSDGHPQQLRTDSIISLQSAFLCPYLIVLKLKCEQEWSEEVPILGTECKVRTLLSPWTSNNRWFSSFRSSLRFLFFSWASRSSCTKFIYKSF